MSMKCPKEEVSKGEMLRKKTIVVTKLPKFKRGEKKIMATKLPKMRKKKKKKQKQWYFTLHHSHFGRPLHRISEKAGKVNKIHYNKFFFFRIIILYIYIYIYIIPILLLLYSTTQVKENCPLPKKK